RHDSGRRDLPPLLVQFVRGPEPDLEKRRVVVEQLLQPLADRQPSHFALALVPGLAAAFTQDRFFLRNRRAMRAQYFTLVRSSHMPEARLICVRDRIKRTERTEFQPRMDTNTHEFCSRRSNAHARRVRSPLH